MQINPDVDLLFLALMSSGLLPPGGHYDYEALSDLGMVDGTLRMIIYFLCGGKLAAPLTSHILTRQPLKVETALQAIGG